MSAVRADRHKKLYSLKLPIAYRSPIKELCRKTRRTVTAAAALAIDAALKRANITPPNLPT